MNRIFYVITFQPGPNWEHGKSMHEQPLASHRQYYQALMDEQKVVIGGVFLGQPTGLSILEAEDQNEVSTICNNDPAIKSGVLAFEVAPLFAVFRGLNSRLLDSMNYQQFKPN